MKFCVAGCAHGHINEFITDMLEAGAEFTGIYNDRSPLVKGIGENYGVKIFDSLDSLLEKVDIAGTTAVNSEKIDIIESCSRYGVHILADKPIVTGRDQLERLRGIVSQGVIQVGMMLTVRFMPEIAEMKKLIDQGTIGRLLSVEIFNPHKLQAAGRPDWHFDKQRGGGVIIDLMPHSIDLFSWLTGSSINEFNGVVRKSILPEKKEFFDSSEFFSVTESGITGYFRVDWHMTDGHWNWGDLRVYCTGTKGNIEVRATGDPLTREKLLVLYREGGETVKIDVKPGTGTVTCDFISRVKGGNYVISHDDILSVSQLALEFDDTARKIVML